MRAAAVENDAAVAGEVEMAHALRTHRVFSIDDFMAKAEILANLIHLRFVEPDQWISLRVEQRFKFSGIEKHAVAAVATFDPHWWLGFDLDDRERRLTRRTGKGRILAEITEMDLAQINVLPQAAKRTEAH